MNGGRPLDLDRLVQAHRVHGAVYTDPGIFALEQLRVFGRSWIFLGHLSQIPRAGDHYATFIGAEPVFMTRGKDGIARGFYNRCPHKGTQILPAGACSTPLLRCPYHGWTFGLDGQLRTIAAPSGYSDSPHVCPGAPEFALAPLPGFDEYRGFVFARLSAQGLSLREWLGPMAESLDNFIDRAPDGDVEVAGGVLRYEHQCNWKFFMENTLDALHPMVVHLSAAKSAEKVARQTETASTDMAFEMQALAPFTGSYAMFDNMGGRVMANGHGELGGQASIHSGYDVDEAYWSAMVAKHGEDRARAILTLSRNNSVAYPSLMFKAPVSLLRVVRPIAVDRTVIETWHFRLRGAPASVFERTIAYSNLVNSAAGMVGPDDHQVYRRMQAGLQAGFPEWIELSRYPLPSSNQTDGATEVKGTSEAFFRNQFVAWKALMGEV